jgi:ABC-type nitrate/sulfonate/bicarbonate transport system substrate-binding protein
MTGSARRSARFAATVVATVLAASACSSNTSTGAASAPASGASGAAGTGGQLETVKMATLAPSSLLWLHAIADKQGFYTKHNVKVDVVQVQTSPALVQAVSGGSADAGISLGDNVISAVDKGASIIISGAILQKAALRLYGSSDITAMNQLAGKAVTAGAVTGGTTDLLRYQAQQAGAAPATLKLLAITNSSDRVVALKNGQVKGAELIPPFDTLAASNGAHMLGWYDNPYVETPLILNTGWAKAHKAAAQGVTQALVDAAKWIYDPANAAAAQQILADYTHADAKAAADAYTFMVTQGQVISPDLTVDIAGLQDIVDISAAVAGTQPAKLDLTRYYDPAYLQP